jgi:hypothetical protein
MLGRHTSSLLTIFASQYLQPGGDSRESRRHQIFSLRSSFQIRFSCTRTQQHETKHKFGADPVHYAGVIESTALPQIDDQCLPAGATFPASKVKPLQQVFAVHVEPENSQNLR